RFAEAGVGGVERIEAAEVLVIEHVDQIHRHTERRAGERWEVLPKPNIHISECPRIGNEEAALGRSEGTELRRRIPRGGQGVTDVGLDSAAEGDQAAELDTERIGHVQDTVRDNVTALVVAGLYRIEAGSGVAEIDCER